MKRAFQVFPLTATRKANVQLEDMYRIVHMAGLSPYAYQASGTERELCLKHDRSLAYAKPSAAEPLSADPVRHRFAMPYSQLETDRFATARTPEDGTDCKTSAASLSDKASLCGMFAECIKQWRTRTLEEMVRFCVPFHGSNDVANSIDSHDSCFDNVASGSSLVHHWDEDLKRGEEHCTALHPDHVILCNNIDYHMTARPDDPPERVFGKIDTGNCIMFRTLDITKPAFKDDHRYWRFEHDTCVYTSYHFNGHYKEEKKFQHKIWDWRGGSTVDLGLHVYEVHVRKEPSSDYKFVLLTPVAMNVVPVRTLFWAAFGYEPRYSSGDAFDSLEASLDCRAWTKRRLPRSARPSLSEVMQQAFLRATGKGKSSLIPSPRPERLKVTYKGSRSYWHILTSRSIGGVQNADDDGDVTWISVDGEYDSLGIPHGAWMQMLSKEKLTPHGVSEEFPCMKDQVTTRNTVIDCVKDLKGTRVDSGPFLLIYSHGDMGGPGIVPDKPRSMQPLMTRIVQVPIAPMKTRENDRMAVHARCVGIQQPAGEQVPPHILEWMDDFVAHYTRGKHCRLWSMAEVLEQQDTAAKIASVCRSILENEDEDFVHDGFLKMENDGGECTGQAKLEPRNIVAAGGRLKAEYMSAIYPFKRAVTKAAPFIAVGWTPEKLESRVQSLCRRVVANTVYEGDISRMDGRKSIVGRILFSKLLAGSFRGAERKKVLQMHLDSVDMAVKTGNNVRYRTGLSLGSGIPDTTDNNSWDMGFMCYCSKRATGAGHDETIAWLESNVLVSGDDSLVADGKDFEKNFAPTVALCGHKAKLEVRRDVPFTFLGRMYARPELTAVKAVNMQRPSTVFTKFTCTPTTLVTDKSRRHRLFLKACAVMTTDPETPYLSTLAKCILKAGKAEYNWEFERVFTALNYNVEAVGVYTSQEEDWMAAAIHKEHPRTDWGSLDDYFSQPLSFEMIEKHPGFTDHVPIDLSRHPTVSFFARDLDRNTIQISRGEGNAPKAKCPVERKHQKALAAEMKRVGVLGPAQTPPSAPPAQDKKEAAVKKGDAVSKCEVKSSSSAMPLSEAALPSGHSTVTAKSPANAGTVKMYQEPSPPKSNGKQVAKTEVREGTAPAGTHPSLSGGDCINTEDVSDFNAFFQLVAAGRVPTRPCGDGRIEYLVPQLVKELVESRMADVRTVVAIIKAQPFTYGDPTVGLPVPGTKSLAPIPSQALHGYVPWTPPETTPGVVYVSPAPSSQGSSSSLVGKDQGALSPPPDKERGTRKSDAKKPTRRGGTKHKRAEHAPAVGAGDAASACTPQ